ncbi:unnamed protein product [Rhizopus stolonifer]
MDTGLPLLPTYTQHDSGIRSLTLMELAIQLWKRCLHVNHPSCFWDSQHSGRLRITPYVHKKCMENLPIDFEHKDSTAMGITQYRPLRRPDVSPSSKVHLMETGSWSSTVRCLQLPVDRVSEPIYPSPWNMIGRCLTKIRDKQLPQATMVASY